jgi:hypothetical protein
MLKEREAYKEHAGKCERYICAGGLVEHNSIVSMLTLNSLSYNSPSILHPLNGYAVRTGF